MKIELQLKNQIVRIKRWTRSDGFRKILLALSTNSNHLTQSYSQLFKKCLKSLVTGREWGVCREGGWDRKRELDHDQKLTTKNDESVINRWQTEIIEIDDWRVLDSASKLSKFKRWKYFPFFLLRIKIKG